MDDVSTRKPETCFVRDKGAQRGKCTYVTEIKVAKNRKASRISECKRAKVEKINEQEFSDYLMLFSKNGKYEFFNP